MTLGSVQPGYQRVLVVAKDAVNAINAGDLCVRDTGITPNGYKKAPATASNLGPFVVCVNKNALASDTAFSAAFPGTIVSMKSQGVITPGAPVYSSATVAGAVSATTTAGDICGRYLGHENELTGKTPGTSSADGDIILVRLGGTN